MSNNIERNNELYAAVRAGNATAREAMICNNLGLVVVKADSLIRQVPGLSHLRDDLVSAGNVGLLRTVNKVPTGRVPMRKLNAFIGACVMKEMLDLLPQERTIYVPARSEALAHNNDCPIEAPIVSNVLPETLETFSETGLVDLRDLMDACCESDAERACLRLREEGYTFQEISDRLGLSLAKVFRMFGKLKARILAEWTRG